MTFASRDNATTALVLFTAAYPFGDAETFVTEELQVLARHFDEILLVPVGTGVNVDTARQVPHNTRVLPPSGERRARGATRYALRHPLAVVRAVLSSMRVKASIAGRFQELSSLITTQKRVAETWQEIAGFVHGHDAVVLYGYWLTTPTTVALGVQSRARLKDRSVVVARAHGRDLYRERHTSGFLPQREEIFRKVDRVYSVSRAGWNYLRSNWPKYAAKMAIARLGVSDATNPLNPQLQTKHVISCSYLDPVKRLELLIQSIGTLQSRGTHVHWTHIGPTDGPYARDILSMAADSLSPGTFRFVGGQSNQEVRTFLADNPATCFVNVSSSEGVPVSIMESLAQGLPVIATDVGGNRETIDVTAGMFDGLLPADPSPQQVADRIEFLLDSSPLDYERYVNAAYAAWKLSWSSESNYSKFATELIGRARTQQQRHAE